MPILGDGIGGVAVQSPERHGKAVSTVIRKQSDSNGTYAAGNNGASATAGNARAAAIAAVTNYRPSSPPLNFQETPTGELFNSNVFSRAVMKQRLPKPIYKAGFVPSTRVKNSTAPMPTWSRPQ